MRAVAIDLETLSTDPSGVILTVGLCFFETDSDVLGTYEVALPVHEQLRLGRTIDARTLGWWMRQSDAARTSVSAAFDVDSSWSLSERLGQIADQFHAWEPETVWGNGSDFDNAMLASLYASVGRCAPWNFWGNRDMRTLRDAFPEFERVRSEVEHSAVHDALAQAKTIRRILSKGQF